MHGLWNGLLTWDAAAELNGQLTLVDLIVFPMEFIALFIVYQLCLRSEKNLLRRELAEEAAEGLLPVSHVGVLSSALQRAGSGWLKRGVNRSLYVQAATRLFEHSQPRPLRSVHHAEGWTPQRIAQQAIPAMRAQFTPLERSQDVFSWDPI